MGGLSEGSAESVVKVRGLADSLPTVGAYVYVVEGARPARTTLYTKRTPAAFAYELSAAVAANCDTPPTAGVSVTNAAAEVLEANAMVAEVLGSAPKDTVIEQGGTGVAAKHAAVENANESTRERAIVL